MSPSICRPHTYHVTLWRWGGHQQPCSTWAHQPPLVRRMHNYVTIGMWCCRSSLLRQCINGSQLLRLTKSFEVETSRVFTLTVANFARNNWLPFTIGMCQLEVNDITKYLGLYILVGKSPSTNVDQLLTQSQCEPKDWKSKICKHNYKHNTK